MCFLLRIVRQYLPLFDNDESYVSEALPATSTVLEKLEELPATKVFDAQKKQNVLKLFKDRFKGVGRFVTLIPPLNYAPFALGVRSRDEDIEDCKPHFLEFMRTFAKSSACPASEKL